MDVENGVLRTLSETTPKFKGDIVFNDGEKDILVSDLASVEEVNEALNVCVTNDKVDTYEKMLVSTEPTEPFYFNPNFDYKDDHVMSSKTVKELIVENNSSLNESLTNQLNDYATKDDLIPDEMVPSDEWEFLYDNIEKLSLFANVPFVCGDYVKIR